MTKTSKRFEPEIVSALDELLPLVTIDVGARNGPAELAQIKDYAAVYCFEPNFEEYQKLDGQAEMGDPPAIESGSLASFPIAIGNRNGSTSLNITRRPGGTSTLRPNTNLLRHFKDDNWSQISEIVKTVSVPTTTLSCFAEKNNISHVDFLKLDTQGNELDILQSAENLLNSVGVIKTEVEFLPLYEGQPLFFDVAKFLTENGFEFVDFQIAPACRRFHRFPRVDPRSYRLVWADMIMVRAPYDAGDPRAFAKAFVLAGLGYPDLASYIVDRAFPDDRRLVEAFKTASLELAAPQRLAGKLRQIVERRLGILISRYNWRQGQQVASRKPPDG